MVIEGYSIFTWLSIFLLLFSFFSFYLVRTRDIHLRKFILIRSPARKSDLHAFHHPSFQLEISNFTFNFFFRALLSNVTRKFLVASPRLCGLTEVSALQGHAEPALILLTYQHIQSLLRHTKISSFSIPLNPSIREFGTRCLKCQRG